MAAEEVLTDDQRAYEALVLAVRTSDGVPVEAVSDDLSLDGLIESREDRMVLTLRGRLLANEVASRLAVPLSM
jgi:oxygen-independent coproporphyrinogen-3 oxidase